MAAFGPALVAADAADAADAEPTLPIRFNAFGTLGLAHSDVDSAEFVRDLSQPHGLKRRWSFETDSVLGVQASLPLGDKTEAVVQLISRYRYDGSFRPEVSLAFLRTDFSENFQMRFGRLGAEFFLFGDSRLVGYSNTTVRPPAEFYGLLLFNHVDGVDATARFRVGEGQLQGKVYAGRSPETVPFVNPLSWDMAGTRLLGGHLEYSRGPWEFRVSRTDVRFSSTEAPFNTLVNGFIASDPQLSALLAPVLPLDVTGQIPEIRMAGTTSRFESVAVVYDGGPLQAHAMLGRINHETESYEDSRAGYLNLSYRLGDFTPYVGYSAARSRASKVTTVPPGPLGPLLNQLAATALAPNSHFDRHTLTLGTRWDFAPHWAAKLQYDAIRGAKESISPFRAAPGLQPQWDGRMNVITATLDFAF